MQIRDRIRELRRVRAADLLPNPKNWRTHPDSQADAMRGVLAEIGWADATLARETPDGLMLIDGHLRAEVAPEAEIPVLVLDVTEAEADKILATHDPLAAMAGANADLLDELTADLLTTDNDELGALLRRVRQDHGIQPPDFQPVSIDEQGRLDEKAKVECPHCGHEFAP